jgi:hypothetical protein
MTRSIFRDNGRALHVKLPRIRFIESPDVAREEAATIVNESITFGLELIK